MIEDRDALFKQYEGLIYKLSKRYKEYFYELKEGNYEFEDVFQIASLGFVKAMNTYDNGHENEAKFETYAYTCIKNSLLQELATKRRIKRNDDTHRHVSLNYMMDDGDAYGGTEFSEVIGEDDEEFRAVVDKSILENILDELKKQFKERDFEIIMLYLKGYPLREIGKRFGISHQAAYLKVKKMRKIVKEMYSEEDILSILE